MYISLFWNNNFDQKVKNKHLFFFLVFGRIRGKRTRAKDQKQTIYFKRPNRTKQYQIPKLCVQRPPKDNSVMYISKCMYS